MNFKNFFRHPYAILVFLIFTLSIGLFWIKSSNSDPQGNAGLWCDKLEIRPISNSTGWVIAGHNTICTGYGGNSAVYIYVHPAREENSSQFLAFRYFQYGGEDLPKLEWIGENDVSIKIDRVSEITKKLNNIGPIRLHYYIRKEDYPQKKGS